MLRWMASAAGRDQPPVESRARRRSALSTVVPPSRSPRLDLPPEATQATDDRKGGQTDMARASIRRAAARRSLARSSLLAACAAASDRVAPAPRPAASGRSPPPAAPPPRPGLAGGRQRRPTVTLTLQVTAGRRLRADQRPPGGAAQIVVPLGWTVQWDWHSTDSTAPHSLVLMAEREKLPAEGGQPRVHNAMTRMVTAGLRPARPTARPSPPIRRAGTGCSAGCPGHALAGEFIGLRVDPEAKTARRSGRHGSVDPRCHRLPGFRFTSASTEQPFDLPLEFVAPACSCCAPVAGP